MGHIDEGDADLLLDALQLDLHLLAELQIERAERLVEQQYGRLDDERPGEGDALLLAARKLAGLALATILQLDKLEHVGHPAPDLVLRHLALTQAEADVVRHAHMREERVVLEHHRRIALVRRATAHRLALEVDLAAVRVLEAADHAERRGLSAA